MLTLTSSEVMVAPRKRRSQKEVLQTPHAVLKDAGEALHLITSALPLEAEAGGVVGALQGAEDLVGPVSSGALLNALRVVQSEAQGVLSSLAEELPTRLRGVSVEGVEVKGVRPDFIVDGGLHVHLDESARWLLVGGAHLPLAPWKKTAQAIARLLSELRNLPFDADGFSNSLFAAYEQALAEAGKTMGAVVPIERILQALALAQQPRAWRLDPTNRNYRGYGRDQLRAQLYRLVTVRPQPAFGRHRLNLTAGSNTENALFMYIPSLGRCAYVGLVSWTPESETGAKS